jgi:hypothetical protein
MRFLSLMAASSADNRVHELAAYGQIVLLLAQQHGGLM